MGKTKPNAISALDRNSPKSRERLPSAIRHVVESHARDSLGADMDKMETEADNYAHPYQIEINALARGKEQYRRPASTTKYKGLKQTSCTWVDSTDSLTAMCTHLNQHHEYAIDLEHHHYRTFQGFLCLMQISTREADYLIDTIALRDELHVLNEYFTDPERVKVLHGADRDVLWLQRDLGLYLVNMFDTGQAARVLNYSSKSLAYALKAHCNVQAQKQYQQADWRIRPLPAVLVNYAREDTHYLLYVYDVMRTELYDQTSDDRMLQGGCIFFVLCFFVFLYLIRSLCCCCCCCVCVARRVRTVGPDLFEAVQKRSLYPFAVFGRGTKFTCRGIVAT